MSQNEPKLHGENLKKITKQTRLFYIMDRKYSDEKLKLFNITVGTEN
jgi:hypothetical protein